MGKPYVETTEEHLHHLRTDARGWEVILRALLTLAADPSGLGPEPPPDAFVCDAEEMLLTLVEDDDRGAVKDQIREERERARDQIVDDLTADILIANLRREHGDLVEAAEAEERKIREDAEDEDTQTGDRGTTFERAHLADERASTRGPRGSLPLRTGRGQ